MPVFDRTDLKRLGGSVLAAAMIQPASAPGQLSHDDRMMAQLIEHQPSGSRDALKYWGGFTPVTSFEDGAVPSILCGSGGDSVVAKLIKPGDSESDDNEKTIALLSHKEMISTIRSALSLQIKELAEILRVQRPTVYSWINDEVEPSAGNRERLQQIYRIASKWRRLCNLPAERLIRSAGTDGHSILELLKADEINEDDVVSRLRGLAAQRRMMKAEADKRRPTAEAIALQHGLSPDDVSDQQHLIDAATGKRALPD
jgi:transcriptional regulator with XRE-family HTH domain